MSIKIEIFQECLNIIVTHKKVVRRYVAYLKNIKNLLYFQFCDLNSIFPSIQFTLFRNLYLYKLSSFVSI